MKKRDDLDLNYFKELLLNQKERLEKELVELKKEIDEITSEDEIDDIEDMAELEIENTRDQNLLKSLKQELKDVNDALKKIDEGDYGFDENTGEKISKERLLAYPAARVAIKKEDE